MLSTGDHCHVQCGTTAADGAMEGDGEVLDAGH